MNFEELKSEELVACGECKALEELVQKVRLFAISECMLFAFAFATFANLEGLEDKERLFATYRSNF